MRNIGQRRTVERRRDNAENPIIVIHLQRSRRNPLQSPRQIGLCEEGFQLLQTAGFSLTMHDNASVRGEEARRYVKLRKLPSIDPARKKKRLHKVLWELKHGEVPKGFVVKPVNRDWNDYRLDNLDLFDRWNDLPFRKAVLAGLEKSAAEAKEWNRFNQIANRNIREELTTRR